MKFIELEGKINPKKRQSASYVKRTFAITKEVKSAVLKITALGVYKATLNGEPLDKQVLLPGYTDYKHRVQFQEYDITSRLKTGENELNAVVGDGWYRGSVGIGSKRNCYGTKTMLGCELTMIYADGTFKTIEADESFLVSKDGPLRENDLKRPFRQHTRVKSFLNRASLFWNTSVIRQRY